MARFQVYEANPEKGSFALQDPEGLCHVARSPDKLPRIGSELEGPAPQLGSGTLQCIETGRDYAVMYDAVACDRQATLEHLHPRLVYGVTPAWRQTWMAG
jgi:hypothetical protein